jgi:hypothetical protein
MFHKLNAPWIHHDQFGTFELNGTFYKAGQYRMVLCCVGSGDKDHVGFFDTSDSICHSTTSKCGGQTGHGGAMSETGTMIDIVGF